MSRVGIVDCLVAVYALVSGGLVGILSPVAAGSTPSPVAAGAVAGMVFIAYAIGRSRDARSADSTPRWRGGGDADAE